MTSVRPEKRKRRYTPIGRDHLRYWTNERIIQAIQAWADEHGHAPSQKDWRHATLDHPGWSHVRDTFGQWGDALRAAGLEPQPGGGRRVYTDRQILDAITDHVVRYGRAPYAAEWAKATYQHPCAFTVTYRFGSWTAGLRAAGVIPEIAKPNRRNPGARARSAA